MSGKRQILVSFTDLLVSCFAFYEGSCFIDGQKGCRKYLAVSVPLLFSQEVVIRREKNQRLDVIILLIVLWLLGERTAFALVSGNNSFVQLEGWYCCGAGNALMILESVLIFNLLWLLQLPAILRAERQLFLWSQRIAALLTGINFEWRDMEMAFAKMRKTVLH